MENSEILLTSAVKALESASVSDTDWAVGGGTVLAHYYNHRLSKDIDIFIKDIQLLGGLSPRFNTETEDALDYDEETNFISLTYPAGKIDFIAADHLTPFPDKRELFFGQLVYLEDPVEIVTKKLFYRGSDVLPRDIFDLACVYHSSRRQDLLDALSLYPQRLVEFASSFKQKKRKLEHRLYGSVFPQNILPGGQAVNLHECEWVSAMLDEMGLT